MNINRAILSIGAHCLVEMTKNKMPPWAKCLSIVIACAVVVAIIYAIVKSQQSVEIEEEDDLFEGKTERTKIKDISMDGEIKFVGHEKYQRDGLTLEGDLTIDKHTKRTQDQTNKNCSLNNINSVHICCFNWSSHWLSIDRPRDILQAMVLQKS